MSQRILSKLIQQSLILSLMIRQKRNRYLPSHGLRKNEKQIRPPNRLLTMMKVVLPTPIRSYPTTKYQSIKNLTFFSHLTYSANLPLSSSSPQLSRKRISVKSWMVSTSLKREMLKLLMKNKQKFTSSLTQCFTYFILLKFIYFVAFSEYMNFNSLFEYLYKP